MAWRSALVGFGFTSSWSLLWGLWGTRFDMLPIKIRGGGTGTRDQKQILVHCKQHKLHKLIIASISALHAATKHTHTSLWHSNKHHTNTYAHSLSHTYTIALWQTHSHTITQTHTSAHNTVAYLYTPHTHFCFCKGTIQALSKHAVCTKPNTVVQIEAANTIKHTYVIARGQILYTRDCKDCKHWPKKGGWEGQPLTLSYNSNIAIQCY